jgi:hypothetical protein
MTDPAIPPANLEPQVRAILDGVWGTSDAGLRTLVEGPIDNTTLDERLDLVFRIISSHREVALRMAAEIDAAYAAIRKIRGDD